jgi:hypothetical protein
MISDTSSSLSLSVVLTPFIPLSFKEKGIKGIGSGLPKSGTDYQAECH